MRSYTTYVPWFIIIIICTVIVGYRSSLRTRVSTTTGEPLQLCNLCSRIHKLQQFLLVTASVAACRRHWTLHMIDRVDAERGGAPAYGGDQSQRENPLFTKGSVLGNDPSNVVLFPVTSQRLVDWSVEYHHPPKPPCSAYPAPSMLGQMTCVATAR